MRKTIVIAALFLGTLAIQAQEKAMSIQKKDGTTTMTRVAELDEISFLTVEEGGQGLVVKTVGGETAGVLFEANPVVTIASGKLVIKSSAGDPVEYEINDIAEIVFGDTEAASISYMKDFSFVLQDGGAVLRGIPQDAKAHVYTVDGRSLPEPAINNGELRLDRATFGSGIFIVKVGTFSTKIKL